MSSPDSPNSHKLPNSHDGVDHSRGSIWRLKGCPRCGGDLFLEKDYEVGYYLECLQCSYTRELESIEPDSITLDVKKKFEEGGT